MMIFFSVACHSAFASTYVKKDSVIFQNYDLNACL